MDLITFLFFMAGFIVLVAGAELLVRGASRLAVTAGVSTLVVGLTVVAYGTSAPELAVSVQSTYAQPPQPDLAIGNVVGSNIANILLVLGISAVVAPLSVARSIVRNTVPFMILLSVLVLIMSWDGKISQFEGALLAIGAVVYTVYAIRRSRREERAIREADEQANGIVRVYGESGLAIVKQLGLIAVGLVLLVIGARWLVNGAVELAHTLGVSELVIGLTIVAVGTSLPEIATSLMAVYRGERDLAVGNAVGSNIFNILFVLGLCSLVTPAGVTVSKPALYFDLPVMIAVALACLPIFFTGYRIERWEGFLFLAYYGAYVFYLFLQSQQTDLLATYQWVMLAFVAPLTVVTLLVVAARSMGKVWPAPK